LAAISKSTLDPARNLAFLVIVEILWRHEVVPAQNSKCEEKA
jgi:hypothetical protein